MAEWCQALGCTEYFALAIADGGNTSGSCTPYLRIPLDNYCGDVSPSKIYIR